MARTLVTLTVALALVALAAVPAVAGGGGHGARACPGFTEGDEVLLRDGCLEGTGHFLADGRDLTVVNEGQAVHDYTAVDGSFSTGTLQPGERARIEAPDAGVYRVYCTLHADAQGRGMAGTLVVGDLGPEAVAAAAASASDDPSAASGLLPSPAGGWLASGAAALAAVALGLVALARRRTATVPADQGV